jgi:hypothetical protein
MGLGNTTRVIPMMNIEDSHVLAKILVFVLVAVYGAWKYCKGNSKKQQALSEAARGLDVGQGEIEELLRELILCLGSSIWGLGSTARVIPRGSKLSQRGFSRRFMHCFAGCWAQ